MIASFAMSTFWKPRDELVAVPRLSPVQWQSAMLPRLVDHGDHGDVGRPFAIPHRHVDGQGLLERRVHVAARTVAVPAADHHQPPAEVAHEHLQRGHGTGSEGIRRNPVEHHSVVPGQRRQRGGHAAGRHDGHLLLGLGERGDQVGGPVGVIRCNQDLWRAGNEHVRVAHVVLCEMVRHRIEDGPKDVEARLICAHVEARGDCARLERQLACRDGRAVRQQPERRPGRDRRAHPHGDLDRLSDVSAGRSVDTVDEHLGVARVIGEGDVQADPAAGGRQDRLARLSRCVVPI